MGQGREPSEIYDYLPMVGGKTTSKLSVAAYEESNAGHQLLVTKHENSGAECWFPDFGKFETSFAPKSVDDASVYSIQELVGNVTN